MAYTDIDKPSDYFNTKLYTGTGAEHNITGVGFQPDWTWIKERNNVTSHRVFDIIRGATVEMFPDLTDGESTDAQSLKSFDSDGFTLGTDGATNGSSDTYVAWNWLASNTTASNTDGSITSTVSANTTSGFSIVSYTGTGSNATVGHGLSSAPKFIMFKNRTVARNWIAYHNSIGATKFMYPNLTNAQSTDSTAFNDTAPTSSVFSLGSNVGGNESGSSIIAYCFAEKKGYSKFGSYTGNGSTDGTFVYTGFKPAFVLIKSTSNAVNWQMQDNKTAPHNLMVNKLFANTSAAQDTGSENTMDFYSNGFKPRGTGSSENINGNGYSYIYMAFASNPFVTSTGIPTTAR